MTDADRPIDDPRSVLDDDEDLDSVDQDDPDADPITTIKETTMRYHTTFAFNAADAVDAKRYAQSLRRTLRDHHDSYTDDQSGERNVKLLKAHPAGADDNDPVEAPNRASDIADYVAGSDADYVIEVRFVVGTGQ